MGCNFKVIWVVLAAPARKSIYGLVFECHCLYVGLCELERGSPILSLKFLVSELKLQVYPPLFEKPTKPIHLASPSSLYTSTSTYLSLLSLLTADKILRTASSFTNIVPIVSKPYKLVSILDLSDSNTESSEYWKSLFLNKKGNEYFCEIEEDYIVDRFNLTGVQATVPHFRAALELILDELELEGISEEQYNEICASANHLYGMIHARYILTTQGLMKMLEKYKNEHFGHCPRIYCKNHPLLPVGLTDIPGISSVRLYCCNCEDIYIPKSPRYKYIDGAYFTTTFPHMFFLTYPSLKPPPPQKIDRFVPKIFGFKVHRISELHKWQDKKRNEQTKLLAKNN